MALAPRAEGVAGTAATFCSMSSRWQNSWLVMPSFSPREGVERAQRLEAPAPAGLNPSTTSPPRRRRRAPWRTRRHSRFPRADLQRLQRGVLPAMGAHSMVNWWILHINSARGRGAQA